MKFQFLPGEKLTVPLRAVISLISLILIAILMA